MRIAIDSVIPYIQGVLEPWGEVRYFDVIGREEALWADALVVRTRTRCDKALLGGTPVRLVASATAGFDHIDTGYCQSAGIEAVWAPGCNARGVLQWVAAALAHCLPEGALGRIGGGSSGSDDSHGAERLTLGVVGVGAVGSMVAEYAAHWGFNVLLCDPPLEKKILEQEPFAAQMAEPAAPCSRRHALATPVSLSAGSKLFHSLEEIAAQADIITFHTPLTRMGQDATFHMGDAKIFSTLKHNTLILNASRGEVIDQRALLQSGLSCCIDTWEDEPNIDHLLLKHAALTTPHIAGYTVQGKANATAAAVRAVARHFGLQPKSVASDAVNSGGVVDLGTWYPTGITPPAPRLIEWDEMVAAMPHYFDIAAETRLLKGAIDTALGLSASAAFEHMRNTYTYREEFF